MPTILCRASRLAQAECGVIIRLGIVRQQGVAVAGRFLGQHIETGTADLTGAQRVRKRLFVYQASAAGVDEQRVGLHHFQFAGTDQIPGLVGQQAVQREHVCLG